MQTITNNSNAGASASNPSYNSYGLELQKRLSKTEKKIVAVLEESGIKITPDTIRSRIMEKYHLADLPPGTIRPLLRRLVDKAVICNPQKGYYCDKLTYEVRENPISIHNIRLNCETHEELESWETTVEIGGVEIYVCFGKERGIISGRISDDRGLSKAACMLAIDKWDSVARERLGHPLPNYFLTRCEPNRDDLGMSFDGSLHCATKEVLKDVLIHRVYEKADCLRNEYCVKKKMTPQQLEESLFERGMESFISTIAGQEQQRTLTNIEKSQKFFNSKLQDIEASSRAVQKKIIDGASKEDVLIGILYEMKETNLRMQSLYAEHDKKIMDALAAKSVEVEELKNLVLSVVQSNAKVAEALTKAKEPEAIPSNNSNVGEINYVR